MYVPRKVWKIAHQDVGNGGRKPVRPPIYLLFYDVNNFYNEQIVLVLLFKMYSREIKKFSLVVCNIHVLIHTLSLQEMLYQMRISSLPILPRWLPAEMNSKTWERTLI